MKKDVKKSSYPDLRMFALAATIFIVAIGIVIVFFNPVKSVNNFEECVAAGGLVMESYPEQCLYNKKTYVNEAQLAPESGTYVGMSEAAALKYAQDNNVPARVVEREGESLPTTMDFVPGRHNFYVQDGAVYKVDIEG